MRKIFYHPVPIKQSPLAFKIMGMSDDEVSMDFPFVTTDLDLHSTHNLTLCKDDKHEFVLHVANPSE